VRLSATSNSNVLLSDVQDGLMSCAFGRVRHDVFLVPNSILIDLARVAINTQIGIMMSMIDRVMTNVSRSVLVITVVLGVASSLLRPYYAKAVNTGVDVTINTCSGMER
jgi:hypothetical protein